MSALLVVLEAPTYCDDGENEDEGNVEEEEEEVVIKKRQQVRIGRKDPRVKRQRLDKVSQ
jgi:hypothetical protein